MSWSGSSKKNPARTSKVHPKSMRSKHAPLMPSANQVPALDAEIPFMKEDAKDVLHSIKLVAIVVRWGIFLGSACVDPPLRDNNAGLLKLSRPVKKIIQLLPPETQAYIREKKPSTPYAAADLATKHFILKEIDEIKFFKFDSEKPWTFKSKSELGLT